jgi:autotransporter translocation and assembly factor TamB
VNKVTALILVCILVLGLTAVSVSAEGELKTGLAAVTSLASSKSATADADGVAQTDAQVVAVTVDQTAGLWIASLTPSRRRSPSARTAP